MSADTEGWRVQPGQWLRTQGGRVRHLIIGPEKPGAIFATACGTDTYAEGLHFEEPDRVKCRACVRSSWVCSGGTP